MEEASKPGYLEGDVEPKDQEVIELGPEELALKRAILSKFRGIYGKSKSELEELLEELVRLNIK